MSQPRVLALGFYHRSNCGDTIYPLVLKSMFSNMTFYCTDDINVVPEGTDIIVCGGGDIVNSQFCSKIRKLLQGFKGPAYLLSVGIPFGGENLDNLKMFDHVFCRTTADYELAKHVLPVCDVTLFRDLAWMLPTFPAVPHATSRVGVTLAQA